MKNLLLIANPISGTKHDPKLPQKLLKEIEALGHHVELRLTEYRGHAHELAAAAAASGIDGVLACGGDGTVNEVASALCGTDTILGILPNGSGNGLARHIAIPCNPIKAVQVIAADNPQYCDWCDANGRPFFCAFGMGFDAAVAHRFASKGKRGFATYIQSAFEEIRQYQPEEYTIETENGSERFKAMFISCCNASQLGNNAYIAPHASIRDGVMDITAVGKSGLLSYAKMSIDLMGGALHESKKIKMLRASKAIIRRDSEGLVHVDGEPTSMGKEVTVTVHPGGLRIFVNPDKKPVRAWLTPLHLT